eukprot:TRINITY_DN9738_c0_g2_i2.p1 TRINITY_DN9738_c0_g2~~TRINITY_DN9738_c0_g2_i2.p1  ORF type:complete len:1012 (-),score=290.86 TRINITY_DN9738_c0_g2_i2:141-3176(-)
MQRTRTRVLQEYIDSRQIDQILTMILDELLQLKFPPDNPYPFILRRLRLHEPEQKLFTLPGATVKQFVTTAVSSTEPNTPVAHGRNNFDAWGLQINLAVCSLEAMSSLKASLGEMAPTVELRDGEYEISVMSALCYPTVVTRSVGSHDRCDWIDLRQEYLVKGAMLEKGMNVFGVHMMQDVLRLNNSDSNTMDVIEGVFIDNGQHLSTWTPSDIQSKQKAFVAELKSSILDRAQVYLQGEFFLSHKDEYGNTTSEFVTVRKRYSFSFVNLEQQASSYAPNDYDTMLEGLFFEKRGAEAYYNLHSKMDLEAAHRNMVKHLTLKLVRAREQGDQWRVLELVNQLAVLQQRTDGILTRLYRIFNSIGGALVSQMQQIRSMRTIVTAALEHQLWNQLNLCKERFAKFKERMVELVFSNQASEFIEMRLGVRAILEELTDNQETFGRLLVDDLTVDRLDVLYDLCSLALESMLQNILQWFPQIQERINQYLTESGHVAAASYTPNKKLRCIDLRTEEARILGEARVPQAVSREAAMMQYLVDARVDQWMEDMLVDMLLNVLPPNPFPTVVHHLRQLSYRYLLLAQPDSEVLDKCSSDSLMVSESTGVCAVSGGYFGTEIATTHVDADFLNSCAEVMRNISDSRQSVKGAVEVRVVCGIRSNCCLVHNENLEFHRTALDFYEEHFVAALEVSQALDVFVESVLQHAAKIHDNPTPQFVTLVTANKSSYTMAQVKGHRNQVAAELKNVVRSKAYITVQFYMLKGNKYIQATKHAALNFKDSRGGRGRFHRMAPSPAGLIHELVFWSQQDAEYVLQHRANPEEMDSQLLEACLESCVAYHSHVAVGNWLECSETSLVFADMVAALEQRGRLQDLLLAHPGQLPPTSSADCLRVLSSSMATAAHLYQACEALLVLVSTSDFRGNLDASVVGGMMSLFCHHLLELVFDDDFCCLEGIRNLVDGRCKLLLQATQTNMFVPKVQELLQQLRNYLRGIRSCIGIVIHESCHSRWRDVSQQPEPD